MSEAPAEWTGFHYDGRTAHREPVTVTLTSGGLQLERADGDRLVWEYHRLRQTQGAHRGEQLRLEYRDEPVQSLVVHEPGLASAIRQCAPRVGARLERDAGPLRLFWWVGGGIAVAAVLYLWAVPALAVAVAPRIPASWERRLGEVVVDRMAPASRRCQAPGLAALRGLLERLTANIPVPHAFTLLVVDHPSVNAFAAPGGYVVVHSGLLIAAESPEELAGVLAHEAQHVLHRHPTRAMVREIPWRIAVSVLGGNEGLEVAARAAGTLGITHYRRSDEREADRGGMELVQAARIDPAGMVEFMQGLDAGQGQLPRAASYLSTHPHVSDRVRVLQEMAGAATYRPVPIMSAAEWAAVREICRAGGPGEESAP